MNILPKLFKIVVFLITLLLSLGLFPFPSWAVLNACPATYLCGEPGPENDYLYPYPGSSCYRQIKDPKLILDYPIEAQKTIPNPGTDSYDWSFTVGASVSKLGIPVIRGLSDRLEGLLPSVKKSLESIKTEENILNQFGPINKLTDFNSQQRILKETVAVSAIDSQCQPPANCPTEGEFSPNPIHDYIIAYAIPKEGKIPSTNPASCNPGDWGFGAEEEAKNNPLSRPIRASEIYCTNSLENGGEVKDEDFALKSKYASTVCLKLYGKNIKDNTSGLYPKLLAENNPKKVFCYLSKKNRDLVFEIHMPLVSHETEPAEISLSFGNQPSAKTVVYLPHLARLEQLSRIIHGVANPFSPQPTQTLLAPPEGNLYRSELICPSNIELVPQAQGGGKIKGEVIPNSESVLLKQTGNLQIAVPELLQIKENLVGSQGFFRNFFDESYLEKLDKEIKESGDALGEGTINLTARNNVDSLSPNEVPVRFPFLKTINEYYWRFLQLFPGAEDPQEPSSEKISPVPTGTNPLPDKITPPVLAGCPNSGERVTVPETEYYRSSVKQSCFKPTMIVIHWNAAWVPAKQTIDYLNSQGLSCHLATDSKVQLQSLEYFGSLTERGYCAGGAGGKNYNNYALNNEISGLEFDSIFNNPSHPRYEELKIETQKALSSTCWEMKKYDIPITQVFGHFQLVPGKPDPGTKYLEYFITRLKELCP